MEAKYLVRLEKSQNLPFMYQLCAESNKSAWEAVKNAMELLRYEYAELWYLPTMNMLMSTGKH